MPTRTEYPGAKGQRDGKTKRLVMFDAVCAVKWRCQLAVAEQHINNIINATTNEKALNEQKRLQHGSLSYF
ncbi:hypothetical protein [Enterovibrio coralii]|nr:hypothetical protein [Enterovibrio coralii]